MVGLNYTISNAAGLLPIGTPVIAVVNGGNADVWADPANPGRFQIKYPATGAATVMVVAPGCAPNVWSDTIPSSGGEATTNNPMVLAPL